MVDGPIGLMACIDRGPFTRAYVETRKMHMYDIGMNQNLEWRTLMRIVSQIFKNAAQLNSPNYSIASEKTAPSSYSFPGGLLQFSRTCSCTHPLSKPSGSISASPEVQSDLRVRFLKAKFHQAIWSQTGPRLVADLLARASSLDDRPNSSSLQVCD